MSISTVLGDCQGPELKYKSQSIKPSFEVVAVCAVNAKLEAPDTSGTTPLILAAALGPEKDRDASVVQALLNKDADPHLQDSNGYSVSMALVPDSANAPRPEVFCDHTAGTFWF
jgi:hypothetical protein